MNHTIVRAGHVEEDWLNTPIEQCVAALSAGGLHSIVQISSGVPDFSVDSFDQLDPNRTGAGAGPAALRSACLSAARLFCTFAENQDQKLDDVHTGRLIRVVVHADHGAIFCDSVVSGQYVVGFLFHRTPDGGTAPAKRFVTPAITSADHAMTDLVDVMRKQLGLPSQNAGGWDSDQRPEPVAGQPHVEGADGVPAADRIMAAASTADLHFVAKIHPAGPELTVDHFDHDQLRRFFGLMTVQARRKFYASLSRDIGHTVGQLGRLVRSTVGGSVVRLVLDVEQGAIYYYRLTGHDYLVGVTLNQNQVSAADDKLAKLATDLSQP